MVFFNKLADGSTTLLSHFVFCWYRATSWSITSQRSYGKDSMMSKLNHKFRAREEIIKKKRFAYPFPDPPLGAAPHSCFHQTDKEAEHSRVALLHLFPVGLQNHIHSSKYLQGSISYTLILQTTLACTFWVHGGPWMASSFRRWPSIFLEWQYCWALFWNDLLAVVSCAICYDRPDLLQSFSYCHWNVI